MKSYSLLLLLTLLLTPDSYFAQTKKNNETAKNTSSFLNQSSFSFDFTTTTNGIVKSEVVTIDNFFQLHENMLKINKSTDNFTPIKSETYNLGYTHHLYKQIYKGVAVEGSGFLLHEKNRKIEKANGKFFDSLKVNTTPTISENKAIEKGEKPRGRPRKYKD